MNAPVMLSGSALMGGLLVRLAGHEVRHDTLATFGNPDHRFRNVRVINKFSVITRHNYSFLRQKPEKHRGSAVAGAHMHMPLSQRKLHSVTYS